MRQQQQKNKIYCDIHPSLKCLHTTCETAAFQLWKIYGLDKNITLCNMYICMDKGPSFCQHIFFSFFYLYKGSPILFCWKFIILVWIRCVLCVCIKRENTTYHTFELLNIEVAHNPSSFWSILATEKKIPDRWYWEREWLIWILDAWEEKVYKCRLYSSIFIFTSVCTVPF